MDFEETSAYLAANPHYFEEFKESLEDMQRKGPALFLIKYREWVELLLETAEDDSSEAAIKRGLAMAPVAYILTGLTGCKDTNRVRTMMEKGAIRAVFQSKLAGLENEIGVDQLYDALGWIVEQLDGDDSDHSGQP